MLNEKKIVVILISKPIIFYSCKELKNSFGERSASNGRKQKHPQTVYRFHLIDCFWRSIAILILFIIHTSEHTVY